jgi:sodium-dependent dicarboxylate transporter 2/3/5
MSAYQKGNSINYTHIIIGLVVFISFILFVDLVPGQPSVTITAAIAILMAYWWVSEAIPIGVTSLLPIILFPVFGVMNGKDISNAYINYVIFLFIGGFLMALALEKWGLHKRIALKILKHLGGSTFKVLIGFMLASSFLSMWMSNTATAMMMLPIAFSISRTLENLHGEEKLGKFPTAILLGIAYACSIGGIATLVGTPPNLSFVRIFEIVYPNAPEITFGQWFIFALPLSIILFSITFFILYLMFPSSKELKKMDTQFFKTEYKKLGKMSKEEIRVGYLFVTLVLLWIFRRPLDLGFIEIPGWSTLFPNAAYLNDGTVAIFVAILLFIIPSSKKNEGLVTWKIIAKIPWNIVLLFGGGFALATAFIESGLSAYIGEQLKGASELSNTALLASVTAMMTFLTEFTSNTATTEMMLPVISSLSNQIELHPLFLMIPITLAASLAFMFPVATPPNAIVFGTGKLKMIDMVKAGIIINIIGILFIVLLMQTWGNHVFNITPDDIPSWVLEKENL